MAHLDLESEGVEERSTRLCNSPDHGSMLITAVESRLKLALIYHTFANTQKVIQRVLTPSRALPMRRIVRSKVCSWSPHFSELVYRAVLRGIKSRLQYGTLRFRNDTLTIRSLIALTEKSYCPIRRAPATQLYYTAK